MCLNPSSGYARIGYGIASTLGKAIGYGLSDMMQAAPLRSSQERLGWQMGRPHHLRDASLKQRLVESCRLLLIGCLNPKSSHARIGAG